MAAAVITVAAATGVPDKNVGGLKFRVRDITADTGTYTTGGFTVTASQLGLKRIYVVVANGATGGTSGATLNPFGITHNAGGASVTLQEYEGAASQAPLLQKDSAEATVANFSARVLAIGI
jgi:hypothetical protein